MSKFCRRNENEYFSLIQAIVILPPTIFSTMGHADPPERELFCDLQRIIFKSLMKASSDRRFDNASVVLRCQPIVNRGCIRLIVIRRKSQCRRRKKRRAATAITDKHHLVDTPAASLRISMAITFAPRNCAIAPFGGKRRHLRSRYLPAGFPI